MTTENPRIIAAHRALSRTAAIVVMLVGTTVLIGWILNIATVKSLLPSWASMKANTALCFLLAGVSLWISRKEDSRRACWLARGLAAMVALVGTITLAEWIFNINLGIDQLLFRDIGIGAHTSSPGRMAPATAVCFMFVASALLILDVEFRRQIRPAQIVIVPAFVFSLLAVIGYLYGVRVLYGVTPYASVALHTALTFTILTLGILTARPNRGVLAIFVSELAGAHLARLLVPVFIVMPIVLGWIRLKGERAGLYGFEFGLGLMVSMSVVSSVALILWAAALLNRSDLKQHQANRALREAEENYRGIFNNAVVGIFRTTPDGRVLAANPQLASMWGYDSPEQLMESITDMAKIYVDPQQLEVCKRLLAEHGIVTRFEHTLYRRDGSVMTGASNTRVVCDERGNILYYDGTLEDITDLKRAEEALKEAGAFNEQVIGCARVGIVVIDRALHYQVWNPFMEELTGLAAADVIGKHPLELFPFVKETGDLAAMELALTGQVVNRPDREYVLAESRRVWVSVMMVPLRGAHDDIVGVIITVNDIAARKKAELDLLDQFKRITLLNHIARAIAERQEPDSIFRAALERVESELPTDFAGLYMYDPQDDSLVVGAQGSRAANKGARPGTKIPVEMTGLRPCVNGEPVYFPDTMEIEAVTPQLSAQEGFHSWMATPLVTEQKVIGIMLATRREVDAFSSEEREFLVELSEHISAVAANALLYQDLQTAYEDLQRAQSKILEQERLRALGTMASGIAHDFNNAVSPVVGFTELLLDNPDEKLQNRERVIHYLRMINTSARDAASIVSRLREFYRARESDEVFHPIELNALIEQAVSLTRPKWKDQAQATGSNIDVHCELGEIPLVAGIAPELREVMTNLIFNATDAMPSGGTITLRTFVEDVEESPASRIVLAIQDTGAGMTEEVRKQCLEPFFTTKGEHGTGLGLPMVHGIARRHDGTMTIQSEVGKGTTISIAFPQYRPAKAMDEVKPQIALQRTLHVLIADDEEMIREVVCAYLTDDGHTVTTAGDGAEALELFYGGKYDLVITDRAMPEMGGDRLAQLIKSMSPAMPIIMLTGFGEFMHAVGEKPEGVDEIVSKPPTLQAVREAVAKVMAR